MRIIQRVEAFVRCFRGHDRKTVNLEEFHQRPPHRHVVFDNEYQPIGVFGRWKTLRCGYR